MAAAPTNYGGAFIWVFNTGIVHTQGRVIDLRRTPLLCQFLLCEYEWKILHVGNKWMSSFMA